MSQQHKNTPQHASPHFRIDSDDDDDDENIDGFDVVVFFHYFFFTHTHSNSHQFIILLKVLIIFVFWWNEMRKAGHFIIAIVFITMYHSMHSMSIYECNYFIFKWINVFKNRNAMQCRNYACSPENSFIEQSILRASNRIDLNRNSLKSPKITVCQFKIQPKFMDVLVSVGVCYSIRLILLFVCSIILTLVRHKLLACIRNMIGMNKSLNIHFCHFCWMC